MKAFTSQGSLAKAEAAWAAAQRLKQFGYAEISRDISASTELATHIVRGWERLPRGSYGIAPTISAGPTRNND